MRTALQPWWNRSASAVGATAVLAFATAMPAIQTARGQGTSDLFPNRISSDEFVPLRLTIERPAQREELVTETEYQTREVTRSRPTWVTETRHRETVRQVPVTRERVIQQSQTVERPVIETAYEEQRYNETVLRPVTTTEQQRHIVQRPVERTEYREETVAVDRPVERTVYRPEYVTSYRPVTQAQTVYSPTWTAVQQPATVSDPGSPWLRWQNRGWVTDPATGQQVWQRPGLHWVRPEPTVVPGQISYMPALVPQQQCTTSYVPEVTQQYRPVTVTENVRQYESRRVPVTVRGTEEAVEIRDVPVTRYEPVTETRVVQKPVNRLRYEQETVTREIPIRETVYETVRENEPYQVQVLREVTETTTERVPHTVQRYVQREVMETIVRDVWVRVPLDANDQRTVSVPRELTIRLADPAARIPANGEIVSLSTLRAMTAARPPVADSGARTQTETSGRATPAVQTDATEGSSLTPVRPREADARSEFSVLERSASADSDPVRWTLQRGISPDAGSGITPAADTVPQLGGR